MAGAPHDRDIAVTLRTERPLSANPMHSRYATFCGGDGQCRAFIRKEEARPPSGQREAFAGKLAKGRALSSLRMNSRPILVVAAHVAPIVQT